MRRVVLQAIRVFAFSCRPGHIRKLSLVVVFLLLVSGVIIPTLILKAATIPPQINKNFVAYISGSNVMNPGEIAKLTIRLFNSNSFDLTSGTFTDTFPAGMSIAATPNIVIDTAKCGAGTVVTPAGDGKSFTVTNAIVPLSSGVVAGECDISIDVTSTTQGNLINTIAAGAFTALDNTSTLVSNTSPASATLAVNTVAAITASKRVIGSSGSTFYTGHTGIFEINLNNNDAKVTLTNVSFDDDFTTGITTVAPKGSAGSLPATPDLTIAFPLTFSTSADCGTPTFNPPLAVGDTAVHLIGASIPPKKTCTVRLTVTQSNVGVFYNNIDQNNIKDAQGVTNSTGAISGIYSVQANTLTVGKSFGVTQIDPGVDTTMRITLRNPNPYDDATGVTVNDVLPTGLVVNTPIVSTISNCGTPAPALSYNSGTNTFTITGATVAHNNATTCTVTVNVQATAAVSNSTLTNNIHTGDVSGAPGFSGADNGSGLGIAATASIDVTGLHLTKTYDGVPNKTIYVNGTSTLRIDFTNPGSVLAGVALRDVIGPGVTIAVPPNNTSTCTGATFDLTNPNILHVTGFTVPGSGSCYVQISVTSATPNASGYVNNIPANADVTIGGVAVFHPATSATLVVVPTGGGGLSAPVVGKSFSNNAPAPGQTDTLTITIRAPMAAPAGNLTNVKLLDTLPTGMVIANTPGASVCGGTLNAPAGTSAISLTGASITGGTTCTITVNVYVVAGGAYTNSIGTTGTGTGYVTADNATDGNEHNVTSVAVTVNASSQFRINKVFAPANITTNTGSSTLTISIIAPANLPLTSVTFNDPLDSRLVPGTPAMSAACGGPLPTIVGNVLSWSGGTVAAGQTCNITVPVTAPNAGGKITNAMAAGAVTGFFGSTTNNASNGNSVSTTLNIMGMSIAKKFIPDTIGLGGISTLVIDVSNYATVPLTGMTFTDNLAATMGNHVVINTLPHLSWTCGGAVTATAGSGSLSIVNGTVPAAMSGTPGTCSISVDVMPNPGNLPPVPSSNTNTLFANSVTTTQGIAPIQDATATLNFQQLDLTITKQFSPNNVTVGTPSNLIVLLQNPQNVPLLGIHFSDNLPAGMFIAANGATFDSGCSGTPTTSGITLNSTSFSVSNVNIAANTTCKITIVASQNVATTLTNTIRGADVTATSGIRTPQDTQASLTYTAFLGVNKSFSSPTTRSDEPVHLNVQFVNAYPNPLTMVSFTDNLTAAGGLRVAPIPNIVNSCGLTVGAVAGASSFTVTGGTLPANSTCTVSVDVVGTTLKTYTNTIKPGDVVARNPSNASISNASGTSASVQVIGYYLGNRVWLDNSAGGTGTLNDGIINGNENAQGIDGVTVTLLGSDGTTPFVDGSGNSQVTTLGGGYYRFDNLPAGTYYVRIDGTNWTAGARRLLGLVSSGSDFNTLQNNASGTNTLDNYDMGIDAAGYITSGIRSGAISLSYTTIPSSESDTVGSRNGTVDSALPDQQANLTVDFGFIPGYNIGNRVWLDNGTGGGIANNGIQDGAEPGIDGVTVTLLDSTGTTPIMDGFGSSQVTTSGGGYYRFDGLPAGQYRVRIDSGNFAAVGRPLFNYINSTGDFNAFQNNASGVNTSDAHDMGVDSAAYLANGILSNTINLSPTTVPRSEGDTGGTRNGFADSALVDAQTNLTVDFGFVQMYSVGNRVWKDDGGGLAANLAQYDNGKLDATESGIGGVRVYLFQSDSTGVPLSNTPIQTNTTNASGYYRFDGLVQGGPTSPIYYVVAVDIDTNTASPSLKGLAPSDVRFVDLTTDKQNEVKQALTIGGVRALVSPPFSFAANAVTIETDVTGGGPTAPDGHGPNGDAFDNLTVDFGFIPTFSLGNRVWYDTNNNGRLDFGESPVSNVKVDLLDAANVPVQNGLGGPMQATTDANGYYRFDGLRMGDYYVVVDKSNWTGASPLVGYASSTNNITQTGAATADNYDNGVDDRTSASNGIKSTKITLGLNNQPSGEDRAGPTVDVPPSVDSVGTVVGDAGDVYDNLTVDFGFYRLSVGDTVWADNGTGGGMANDGLQNGGELGIDGVRLELFKTSISTTTPFAVTTTAGGGKYLFNQQTDTNGVGTGNPLLAGNDYYIVIPRGQASLQNYVSSTDLASSVNPTVNGVNADDNGTGTASAATSDTTSTTFTLDAHGNLNTAGSIQNANAWTDNPTVDFGFHLNVAGTYSIGNRVWFDDGGSTPANANNGILDTGENGLDGVRVLLYNADTTTKLPTTLVDTRVTGFGGYYRFDSIPAGDYIVVVDITNSPALSGMNVSNQTYADYTVAGDKHNKGQQTPLPLGSAAPNGIYSGVITIGPANPPPTGELDVDNTGTKPPAMNGTNGDALDQLTADFGFYRPPSTIYSIGNRVWLDNGLNGVLGSANDGIQNGSEPGIAGVTVYLYQADATGTVTGTSPLQQTVTDGDGYYRFDNVPAGTTAAPLYYVVAIDANSTPLNGLAISGTTLTDYTTPGDKENKGKQTTQTLPGSTVGTTITAYVSGSAVLLPPTSAVLTEPDVTSAGAGAHASIGDSNDILTVDFGFNANPATAYSIGNRIWLDDGAGGGANVAGDGIQGPGEAGIALVPVKLFAANASGIPQGVALQATNTDANGYYRFDSVTPGSYVVIVDLPSLNGSSAVKYRETPISFTNLSNNTAADFDLHNKGAQTLLDASTPLPGGLVSPLITVPPAGTLATNETDVPGGTNSGAPNGHGPAGDSHDLLTADFGLVVLPAGTYSIGNRVWLDNGGGVAANMNNGKQDAGEPGIPDVRVVLFNADAAGQPTGAAVASSLTDNSGYYRFDGLPAGNYVVVVDANAASSPTLSGLSISSVSSNQFDQAHDMYDKGLSPALGTGTALPGGYASSQVTLGAANIVSGEPDVTASGTSSHSPLGDDSDNLTADFGFYQNPAAGYSIGNRVWLDNGNGGGVANDGIQNGSEAGIGTVTVKLFYADASGNPIGNTPNATTVTTGTAGAPNATTDGYYRFDNLNPGNYVVVIDRTASSILNGFMPSPIPTGAATNDQSNKGLSVTLSQTSVVPGGISSGLVTITAGALPAGEIDVSNPAKTSTGVDAHGPNGDAQDNLIIDFGFTVAPSTYSIGNRVWSDNNANGTQDNGETGLGGITVYLFQSDANGNPTVQIGKVVTDSHGFYRFDGMNAGDYAVIVDAAALLQLYHVLPNTVPVANPQTNTTDALNNGILSQLSASAVVPGGIASGRISLGARPTEPLGEMVPVSDVAGSFFKVGNAPQSGDDRGNLTIDFGFVPNAPSSGGSGATGNTGFADPAIVKLVDPALALPGETVTFTITVTNHGTLAAQNVVVVDDVPTALQIISVDTGGHGTSTVTGYKVTFNIGQLNPGEIITLHIQARIRPDVIPPLDLTNTARLGDKESSATVRVTHGDLPATGEHPDDPPSMPTFLLIGFVGSMVVLALLPRLLRRRSI